MLDKNREQHIIDLLAQKGATRACSRCGNTEFEIIAEAELRFIADDLSRLSPSFSAALSEPLPILVTACKNCGYMFHYAKALLGLTG